MNKNPSWGVWALAAAGILGVVALFAVLSPSEPDWAPAQKAAEARARAAQEAAAERQAERDRLEREREAARTEAERRRLEAEAHLREIEKKRELLAQAKPEPQEAPQAKEKREQDLAELKREKDRIEQELREAAALAKKAEPPATTPEPLGERPQSTPARPSGVPQAATQAAIARVEEVAGETLRITKEGKVPLVAATDLFATDGLETKGGTSRIALRFPDKTRLELGPDTILAEVRTDVGKRLSLSQGTLRAVVAKQPKGEPMIFSTPRGQAKVVGTMLRIVVDPDPKRGMRLDVEEGKVELGNLVGKTVLVESGHYAIAAEGVELVARRVGAVLFSDSFAKGVMAPGWKLTPATGYWSVVKEALQATGPTAGNWTREQAEIAFPAGASSLEVQMMVTSAAVSGYQGITVVSAGELRDLDLAVKDGNQLAWGTSSSSGFGGWKSVGPIDGTVMHTYKIVLESDSTFTMLVDREVRATKIVAGDPSAWANGIARGILFTQAESSGRVLNSRFTRVVAR